MAICHSSNRNLVCQVYLYIFFTLNFLLVSEEEKRGENDAPQSAIG